MLTSSRRPQPVRATISRKKLCFSECILGECDVGRRVLEQHLPPQLLLHLVDMIADQRERRVSIGQRQQVVEEGIVMARPGKML